MHEARFTHVVCVVSRFLSNPGKEHWEAVKWIFKNSEELQFCLCFGGGKPVLVGYTDADMACDIDSRKSTSGLLVTFVGKLFLGCLNYKVCCLIYNGRRVYCWKLAKRWYGWSDSSKNWGCIRNTMLSFVMVKVQFIWVRIQFPYQIEAYWCEISLDTRGTWQRVIQMCEDKHRWEQCWYVDKRATSKEAWVLPEGGRHGLNVGSMETSPSLGWRGRLLGRPAQIKPTTWKPNATLLYRFGE